MHKNPVCLNKKTVILAINRRQIATWDLEHFKLVFNHSTHSKACYILSIWDVGMPEVSVMIESEFVFNFFNYVIVIRHLTQKTIIWYS